MKKITLPEEGIETLFGSHDANLKHIESLLDVRLSTQGAQYRRRRQAEEARVATILEQRSSCAKRATSHHGDA